MQQGIFDPRRGPAPPPAPLLAPPPAHPAGAPIPPARAGAETTCLAPPSRPSMGAGSRLRPLPGAVSLRIAPANRPGHHQDTKHH